MSRIDKLVAERDALRREWQSNHAARIKIQHRLDQLTHTLSELTGLPVMIGDVLPRENFLGLGRRSRRRRI